MRIRRSLVVAALAAAFVLALPVSAQAGMRYVSVVGNDSTGDGTFAHPYASVQKAVDVAVSADVVSVGPGQFTGDVTMKPGVSLRGAGAHLTTLHGTGIGPVVIAQAIGAGATVSGFMITGGKSVDAGGGIWCNLSSPTITGNTITGNSAGYGGGGIACLSSRPVIQGNIITANTTYDTADDTGYGGGVLCYGGSSPTITGNTVTGNSANHGGAISCDYSGPSIAGNTITSNSATATGGAIDCVNESTPTVVGNTIGGNSATAGGGGICCGNSSPEIACNTIVGNTSGYGGGIDTGAASSPVIVNNVIAANTAVYGGGLLLGAATGIAVCNDTIVNNSALSTGGGINCLSGTPAITNCIVWANNTDLANCVATYCDVSAGGAGVGVISADPDFVAPGAADYRLAAGSPCVDVATSAGAPAADRDGIARPWGAGVDMGSFEFFAPTMPTNTRVAGASIGKTKKPLTLSGTVSPAVAPGKVTITKTYLVGKKSKSAGSVKVGIVGGKFTYSFRPTVKGSWKFAATYPGGVVGPTTYLSSKSGVKTVKVK